ncbi:MAG: hypothetical protein QG615_211, partial [Nitrospirota bacterium]|nr:hypothetical protein [Nitrospirota bacterium]
MAEPAVCGHPGGHCADTAIAQAMQSHVEVVPSKRDRCNGEQHVRGKYGQIERPILLSGSAELFPSEEGLLEHVGDQPDPDHGAGNDHAAG